MVEFCRCVTQHDGSVPLRRRGGADGKRLLSDLVRRAPFGEYQASAGLYRTLDGDARHGAYAGWRVVLYDDLRSVRGPNVGGCIMVKRSSARAGARQAGFLSLGRGAPFGNRPLGCRGCSQLRYGEAGRSSIQAQGGPRNRGGSISRPHWKGGVGVAFSRAGLFRNAGQGVLRARRAGMAARTYVATSRSCVQPWWSSLRAIQDLGGPGGAGRGGTGAWSTERRARSIARFRHTCRGQCGTHRGRVLSAGSEVRRSRRCLRCLETCRCAGACHLDACPVADGSRGRHECSGRVGLHNGNLHSFCRPFGRSCSPICAACRPC